MGSPDSIGSEEDKQEEDEEEDQEEGAGVGKEAESKRTPGLESLPAVCPTVGVGMLAFTYPFKCVFTLSSLLSLSLLAGLDFLAKCLFSG